MKIHELPGDPGRTQKRKRVGRGHGSGSGKTAGRGHKGAGQRSGGGKAANSGHEGGQMPIYRKLPKRGFFSRNKLTYQVVNLMALNDFEDGAEVNKETLRSRGLIGSTKKPVKLLGEGELTRQLTVTVDRASASAADAITARGGTIDAVVGKPRSRNAPRRGTGKAAAGGDSTESAE
jgi:large subunit ribosomal protein L15